MGPVDDIIECKYKTDQEVFYLDRNARSLKKVKILEICDRYLAAYICLFNNNCTEYIPEDCLYESKTSAFNKINSEFKTINQLRKEIVCKK